jgi:hypothetical protein
VKNLDPSGKFGFLEAADGHEVYCSAISPWAPTSHSPKRWTKTGEHGQARTVCGACLLFCIMGAPVLGLQCVAKSLLAVGVAVAGSSSAACPGTAGKTFSTPINPRAGADLVRAAARSRYISK